MRLTEKELRDAWRRLSARQPADRSSCLAPEHLWIVAQGRLEGESRSRATAHLARCSDCSRELQLVSAIGEFAVSQGAELVSRRRRLPRGGGRFGGTVPPRSEVAAVSEGFVSSGPLAWTSGALLLLFLIAAVWAFTLLAETSRLRDELEQATSGRGEALQISEDLAEAEEELARLREEKAAGEVVIAELEDRIVGLGDPVLNPTVVNLDLRRVERTGESVPRQQVALPAGARWFTVAVTLPQIPPAPAYSIEVLDSRGEVVWRAASVELEGRSFSISFPTQLLSRGIYHLRLLARGESGTELVEHIPLELSGS